MDRITIHIHILLLLTCITIVLVGFHAYSVRAQDSLLDPIPVLITDDTNVDPYVTGKLNGQDGWSSGWNSPTVQDQVVFEGQNALQNQNNFGTASYKELGSDFSDAGVISTKIRIENNSFGDNQDIFGLYKGVGEEFVALFRFGNNFDNRHDALLLSIAESADVREVGSLTQGQWHTISLGWRRSDFNIRIKIDGGVWSEWFSSETSWSDGGALGIKIVLPNADIYGNFYQDDIRSFVGYEESTDEPLLQITDPLASSTATDALRQLSISLSTTSITSNLDNGLIVTASLDGIANIATSSILASTSTPLSITTSLATSTETSDGSFVREFLMDIVENVIDLFIPSEPTPAETTDVTDGLPTEPVVVDNQQPESEIQSSVTADITHNEVTTTTF